MKLEEKITLLRKKQGWSQEELAFRLEVSRQAVSKWEMGASVPDLDKILKMSELFGCTTDYLLKEEAEESVPVVAFAQSERIEQNAEEKKQELRTVTDEEGIAYLGLVKNKSWIVALGVALCVLSPVTLFVLLALSTSGALSEELASGLGTAAILLMCACGVVCFIFSGIALSKYDYLEKEEIGISENLKTLTQGRKEENGGAFTAAIACGVALCILSALPIILSGALSENDGVHLYAVAGLFPFIAVGVFLFVRFGMVRSSFLKLLQEEDFTPEKKRMEKKKDVFASVYWCVITAAYLAVSFTTMKWEKTWIVWPVAGALFGAIAAIVGAVKKNGK